MAVIIKANRLQRYLNKNGAIKRPFYIQLMIILIVFEVVWAISILRGFFASGTNTSKINM